MRFRLFLGTNELRNVTLKNVAVLDHPPPQAAYSHSAPVGKPLLKAPPFALTVPTVLRCPMAGVAIRDRSNAAVAKNFVPMLFYNSFVVIRCYADELPTNCRRTEERQSAKERSAVVKRTGKGVFSFPGSGLSVGRWVYMLRVTQTLTLMVLSSMVGS